ncbi:MAG: hypothetical protein P1U61_02160 [Legionellaceae bacterium]|nr:hypothetical protein [Legionellaceae bacterium]
MTLKSDTQRLGTSTSDFSDFKVSLKALSFDAVQGDNLISRTPFMRHLMEGGQAWAMSESASPAALKAFSDVVYLIELMDQSSAESFRVFIEDIQQKEPDAYQAYEILESHLFPGLGFDGAMIFKVLKENEQPIQHIIPPQFRAYQAAIADIKGTPASHLFGSLFGYALGFAPYILGGVLARELTGVSSFQRMTLAAAPTALGGIFRLWAAQKVDEGCGKQAISTLFTMSLCGLVGIFYLVYQTDLPDIRGSDLAYWGLMLSNALSGAGIATFSAAMPMCARNAPGDVDKLEEREARLLGTTGTMIKTTTMDYLLRKNAADHMALVAGIGGLTPPIALLAASAAVPRLGLAETYAVFGAITLTGQLGLNVFWQNLVLDQLREHEVPMPLARDIALWMGQKQRPDPSITFFQKLNALDDHQIHALLVMCASYVATFGVLMAFTSTGTLMLERRGASNGAAAGLIAAVSGVSTLVRSGMAIPKWSVSPSMLTNLSLASMAISLLLFAVVEGEADWIPLLFVFAIANGVGNYAVFAQIAEELSEIVGLASGLAGGVGAFSAIFINVAFAGLVSTNKVVSVSPEGLPQTDTANEYLLGVAICALCLTTNVIHDCFKHTGPQAMATDKDLLVQCSNTHRYGSVDIEESPSLNAPSVHSGIS